MGDFSGIRNSIAWDFMSDKTSNRKLAYLPNTQILCKYGSIFSQLWLLYPVLRYFDTIGTFNFIPFLWTFSLIPMTWTSTLSSLIQRFLMNSTSPLACLIHVSNHCAQSLLHCFPSQIWFSLSVSSQLSKPEKGGIILCFCTSMGYLVLCLLKAFEICPFLCCFSVIAFALTIICLDYCRITW